MELQIADNIKRLRKAHCMTQEQLAAALDVTTGAVYKWESGQSYPELRLLVEMAALFETSVDAILGYGWEQGAMGRTAQQIRAFGRAKNFDEGIPYAEQAMKRYPNSFEIVYQSAELHFHRMQRQDALRALELYRDALRLLAQSPYEGVTIAAIETSMALCDCLIGKKEEALALFRKHNADGRNNARIGLLLSGEAATIPEALPYLSAGLSDCCVTLYNLCIGYANCYASLERFDDAQDLLRGLYQFTRALRYPDAATQMDRWDVILFLSLAELSAARHDLEAARAALRSARESAARFDANPSCSLMGKRYSHGQEEAVTYDEMEGSAADLIETVLRNTNYRAQLQPLWEDIIHEA